MGSLSEVQNHKVHENPVYDLKLSSVGPGNVTETGVHYEPTNVDLAMKLHYLQGLYFFTREAVEGLTVLDIKTAMFTLFNRFNVYCGRFRRSDESSRRPYIKCNDCGARMIEAKCKYTLDECLEMKDDSLHKLLVFNQVLGPELAFSPPILFQFTWFKCGGMSIGLSWAHVLGDAFSASHLINSWGQLVSTDHMPHNLQKLEPKTVMEGNRSFVDLQPLSRRVDPVGDYWKFVNDCNMITSCFQIDAAKLDSILVKINGQCDTRRQIPTFECLCAIIWQTLAKIRTEVEPQVITVCRNRSYQVNNNAHSGNNQMFGTVKAECQVKDANPCDLAALMLDKATHEQCQIDQVIEKDGGLADFVVYGANLTFGDLEKSEIYELELKGHKPVFANYMVEGVADSGLVLVLPGPRKGRTVTAILPENEILQLRAELDKEWCIV